MSQRTYHDPLHGGIQLNRNQPAEAMVMDLVDKDLDTELGAWSTWTCHGHVQWPDRASQQARVWRVGRHGLKQSVHHPRGITLAWMHTR